MPAAAAMRSSIALSIGVWPLFKNIPALVRMPLATGPDWPTTVLGASWSFACSTRCAVSSAERKLRNRYAFGCFALKTTGGVCGKPGIGVSWFRRPYTERGSGSVERKKRSSGVIESDAESDADPSESDAPSPGEDERPESDPESSTTSRSSAEEETSPGRRGRTLPPLLEPPGPFGREDPLSGACFFPQGRRPPRRGRAPEPDLGREAAASGRGSSERAPDPTGSRSTAVSVAAPASAPAPPPSRCIAARTSARTIADMSSRASVLMDVPDGALVPSSRIIRNVANVAQPKHRAAMNQGRLWRCRDERRPALFIARAVRSDRRDAPSPGARAGLGGEARISGETEPREDAGVKRPRVPGRASRSSLAWRREKRCFPRVWVRSRDRGRVARCCYQLVTY
jgi:hypothetical protein